MLSNSSLRLSSHILLVVSLHTSHLWLILSDRIFGWNILLNGWCHIWILTRWTMFVNCAFINIIEFIIKFISCVAEKLWLLCFVWIHWRSWNWGSWLLILLSVLRSSLLWLLLGNLRLHSLSFVDIDLWILKAGQQLLLLFKSSLSCLEFHLVLSFLSSCCVFSHPLSF